MRGRPEFFADFRGGLNTRDGAYEIERNQARELLNVACRGHGSIRQRDGTYQFASAPNPLTSLYGVEAISPRRLIAADPTAGVFRSIDTAGAVASLGGTTGTARWTWLQAAASGGQGPLYGMNGTNPPVHWTGSTLAGWTAATGTLPNGKYMAYAGGRVWVAGMSAYGTVTDAGSTVVFSNLYNPRDWPTANVVQFAPGDGDAIRAIVALGPYVLVFKQHKVWVIYDLDTGANRQLSQSVGCVAPDSAVETPHGVFFLHDSGVYLCDGTDTRRVSDVIAPTIDAIPEASLQSAVGAYADDHYLLAHSSAGGANNLMLDYDVRLSSWWLHSIAASSIAVWRASFDHRAYVTDPATGRVGRLFEPAVAQDYAANFTSRWTGGWITPKTGGSLVQHRVRGLRADLRGHVSLAVARDFAGDPSFVADFDYVAAKTTFGGAGQFGGAGAFADPATFRPAKAPTLGIGRAFSVRWFSNHEHTWELENFALLFTDRQN